MPNPNIKLPNATGVLVLSDGAVFWGYGCGAEGIREGGICFNTAMTGYQEILTDPGYAGQMITFTFPYIGNTGVNEEDMKSAAPAAKGLVLREKPTSPSNWRATDSFNNWLIKNGITGIYGIDTRELTVRIRDRKVTNAVIAYSSKGEFDIEKLKQQCNSKK
ncbi:MAG: hypothetical protein FWF23_04530 [Alphaproteobacteria bacterium]|nr:hypothetical protein [Alphaproteobacteria bacterium]MCL2505071.1 hypothetical protein [Alphaproteobacteria bacterium]